MRDNDAIGKCFSLVVLDVGFTMVLLVKTQVFFERTSNILKEIKFHALSFGISCRIFAHLCPHLGNAQAAGLFWAVCTEASRWVLGSSQSIRFSMRNIPMVERGHSLKALGVWTCGLYYRPASPKFQDIMPHILETKRYDSIFFFGAQRPAPLILEKQAAVRALESAHINSQNIIHLCVLAWSFIHNGHKRLRLLLSCMSKPYGADH